MFHALVVDIKGRSRTSQMETLIQNIRKLFAMTFTKLPFNSEELPVSKKRFPWLKRVEALSYCVCQVSSASIGHRTFCGFVDDASLRTAINSPHLSPIMARGLPFYSNYNFKTKYKPGKTNVMADALSRRPDFEEDPIQTSTIFCKILATRLQRVLPVLIGDTQQGFVRGRQMLKLVMMMLAKIASSHEVDDFPADSSCVILLLDFRKAYNTVDREFMYEALRLIHFDEHFSSSYSVCIHE